MYSVIVNYYRSVTGQKKQPLVQMLSRVSSDLYSLADDFVFSNPYPVIPVIHFIPATTAWKHSRETKREENGERESFCFLF